MQTRAREEVDMTNLRYLQFFEGNFNHLSLLSLSPLSFLISNWHSSSSLQAMKLYNGRTLDGRVLEMSKIEERPAPGVASKRGRGRGVMSRLGKSSMDTS